MGLCRGSLLRAAVALALCVVGGATAGCGTSADPAVVVTPSASRGDEPVSIEVTGLEPGAVTQVGVTSTDGAGEVWSSSATFTAGPDGVVDPTSAASSAGSYLGVSPTGLITAMRTGGAAGRANLTYRAPASDPSTFDVTVHAPGVDRSATFTRTFLPDPVTATTLTLDRDHVSGTYLAPADPSGSRPAVLLLGGSNGGVASLPLAQALAARGVPTLAIAYFGAPGLPRHLTDVPVEYLTTALTWLARQPGVDRGRLWAAGGSYGSEAALLVASERPDLVHGALSLSGGNTVTCSVLPGATIDTCAQAPFTRGGKPVPYTRQFDNPAPTDEPRAVIPVERIEGPVVAVCGGADVEWDACRLSQAVLDRRTQHGAGEHDLLLAYPDAGHYVNFLLAWRPVDTPVGDRDNGSTPQANADADSDAWPKVLAALQG